MNQLTYITRHVMPRLSGPALATLLYLLDNPTASWRDIGSAITSGGSTASHRTIKTALASLIDLGYLEVERAGKWQAPTYRPGHALPSDLFPATATVADDQSSATHSATVEVAPTTAKVAEETPEPATVPATAAVALNISKPLDSIPVVDLKGGSGGKTPTAAAVAPDLLEHDAVRYWLDTFQEPLAAETIRYLASVDDLEALKLAAADFAAHPRWNPTNVATIMGRYQKHRLARQFQPVRQPREWELEQPEDESQYLTPEQIREHFAKKDAAAGKVPDAPGTFTWADGHTSILRGAA